MLEGETATFVVTLTDAGSAPVVISYSVGGTATAGEDYTAPGDKLTIPAGRTSGTIAIRIADDDRLEPAETLEVTLTGATTTSGLADYSETAASVTIGQSDGPVFVSIPMTISIDEGDTALVTVTLTGPLPTDLTLTYSTEDDDPPDVDPKDGVISANGQARNACGSDECDYYEESGEVKILSGQTTATFMVETRPDQLAETSESFNVAIELPQTIPAGIPADGLRTGVSTAKATITDDALTVTVTGPPTVDEGGTAEFTVTLVGGSGDEEVDVSYGIGGTATAADYTSPGTSVSIPAGANSAVISIEIEDDTEMDLGETLEVTLTGATSTVDGESVDVRVGSPGTATTTIVDNDGAVMVSAEDPATVVEGEPVVVEVMLSGSVASDDVIVGYATADGTGTDGASAGTDYTAVTGGALTIPAGERSGSITIETEPDQAAEGLEEEFAITLSLVSQLDNVELAADATVTAKITDYALLYSVAGEPSVPEGMPATFTVNLDADGDARGNRTNVVVTYTTADSTASAADFTAPSGTLTIPSGSLTGTIEIPTETDDVLDHETLVVRVTDATPDAGVVRPGTPVSFTTTIADSGAVDVTVSDVTVEEGDPAVFTIALDGMVAQDVTVGYATAAGTATAAQDYAMVNRTVVISAGDTEAMVTVNTTEDSVGEAEETFTLTLSLPAPRPWAWGSAPRRWRRPPLRTTTSRWSRWPT